MDKRHIDLHAAKVYLLIDKPKLLLFRCEIGQSAIKLFFGNNVNFAILVECFEVFGCRFGSIKF